MCIKFIVIYVLIVLIIAIKTIGLILIIKGFMNKVEKLWIKGFVLFGLAAIMFVTTLFIGASFHKYKNHEMKNDFFKKGKYMMRGPGFMKGHGCMSGSDCMGNMEGDCMRSKTMKFNGCCGNMSDSLMSVDIDSSKCKRRVIIRKHGNQGNDN